MYSPLGIQRGSAGNMLPAIIAAWLYRRRNAMKRRLEAAHDLLTANPFTAYYDAHRLAARSRFGGDGAKFLFWASVAAEIARISNNPMDGSVVETIVAGEERAARDRT